VSEHTELVEIHERDFQNFSIEHDIYHVPVDEVSLLDPVLGQCSVLWCKWSHTRTGVAV